MRPGSHEDATLGRHLVEQRQALQFVERVVATDVLGHEARRIGVTLGKD